MENRYLGYYNDAGAYYYYHTEEGMNYDETFQHIRRHLDKTEWPVRFTHYGSWFYPHGEGNGLKHWEFLTDDKNFPRGGEAAYIDHQLPMTAHNRWFGPDNLYAVQNGGDYEFVIENKTINFPIGPPGSGIGPYALPNDTSFWDEFLANRRQWGLMTYEQDWMDKQVNRMEWTQQVAGVAANNLYQMNHGAEIAEIDIQYCMSTPRIALTSLEV